LGAERSEIANQIDESTTGTKRELEIGIEGI
jgi:hypothetical protein